MTFFMKPLNLSQNKGFFILHCIISLTVIVVTPYNVGLYFHTHPLPLVVSHVQQIRSRSLSNNNTLCRISDMRIPKNIIFEDTKGQFFSKILIGILGFSQKTNERIRF